MTAPIAPRDAREPGNRRRIAAVAAGLLLVAGCSTNQPTPLPVTTPSPGTSPSPAASTPGPTGTPVGSAAGKLAISLEPFASVEGGPLAMAAVDDGTGRLLVAAQDGRIWVVERDGSAKPDPMIDLGPRITSGGERGLLGIAVHPTFPTDPRVFVDYTDTNGDSVIASLRVDPEDPDRLDPDSHQQLLFVDQPYPNHNGGALAFGPDGDLYVSFGDGGGGGDPQGNGQRLDSLLGKILRLEIDETDTYLIPEDNPFAEGGGRPEIWLYGLRNPWRMSFDRETGDLWIGDVGQGSWEEIDVARAGLGGINFGWRVMEGSHCYNADTCDREHLTLPATDYGRDQGCTVIGGSVYRGDTYSFLRGTYLFADYCSGNLFAIDASAEEYAAPTVVGNGPNGIAAFGQDTEGELYTLALDGTISKVVATRL
jgi:glucose/arabinose dehydrogenase